MFKRSLAILLLLISIGGFYHQWRTRVVSHPPGILAPDKPRQEKLDKAKPFQYKDYKMTPLATFSLTARILGRENYYFDREAELSPLDFALGWGRMSDEAVLQKLTIWQSRRFYYWKTDRFPIPRREIETSSANMHLIPADDEIAGLLDEFRVGHIISLEGMLVKAKHPDGWRWTSSLTRGDTGGGACELFWVTKVANVTED